MTGLNGWVTVRNDDYGNRQRCSQRGSCYPCAGSTICKAPMIHRSTLNLIVILVCLSVPATVVAQDSFSSLEEKMTGKEFTEAGLDKLTDDELAALNAWIRSRSLAEGEAVAVPGQPQFSGEDPRGFENFGDNSDIESSIVGQFTGWRGNTVFELENGMIWEQTDASSFSSRPIMNPRVTIESGLLGSWRMRVEGLNRRVQVRRIQ